MAVWITAPVAFTIHPENFANDNASYGSHGARVGVLSRVRISVTIIIGGAALNAEMEHRTARNTTDPPVRATGRRGAVVAETLFETPEPKAQRGTVCRPRPPTRERNRGSRARAGSVRGIHDRSGRERPAPGSCQRLSVRPVQENWSCLDRQSIRPASARAEARIGAALTIVVAPNRDRLGGRRSAIGGPFGHASSSSLFRADRCAATASRSTNMSIRLSCRRGAGQAIGDGRRLDRMLFVIPCRDPKRPRGGPAASGYGHDRESAAPRSRPQPCDCAGRS